MVLTYLVDWMSSVDRTVNGSFVHVESMLQYRKLLLAS